ncbi:cell envelope integrity protein CreD [Sphingorhabdus sp. Alg239-R122]|uniref:cell envelope integrity protein CreD n=1 Tax=Sphingorhabdus sp. Alg239-R122 TaxID=2305989 RepID=UPI0013DBA8AF|nr:cell envelope integrity protein CreD [Sphingorhabdus sp. Alg239-R122]
MAKERSPGFKLGLTIIIGALLIIPLLMVYGLVWDRQSQSNTATSSVAAGWGGPQVLSGPVMVIPYREQSVETVTENGKEKTRAIIVTKELYLSPVRNSADIVIDATEKRKSIYRPVVYTAKLDGKAQFAVPDDLDRYGIDADSLDYSKAELRIGVSDARGLQAQNSVTVDGEAVALRSGKGLLASNNSGFHAFVDWSQKAGAPIDVSYIYSMRGNGRISLVPRAEQTLWNISSKWPHPGFGGDFLPDDSNVSDEGFSASYSIANLALGQSIVQTEDLSPPQQYAASDYISYPETRAANPGISQAVQINLIQPVNLYNQVDRALKYGFLFIGFTFVSFLMFDIIGGARVAAAEYILTGAGLILFFVLLLAFAELIGFAWAYLVAAAAIIGLVSAYSASILGSWRRAGFIAALLAGLYALLYVLLNLEELALIIGSVLLFFALAAIMYVTRNVDWSGIGRKEEEEAAVKTQA